MHLKMRPRPILIIVILLLLLAACNQEAPEEQSEPTATAEVNQSTVQYVPYVDNELGLSIQHPANWVTQSAFGGATFATSQAVIDAESLADIGEDAFVVVIPGEIDYFNFQTAQSFSREDVLQALATYKALLEKEGQEYVTIELPQAFTGQNQNMARMILRSTEGSEPVITVLAVVMGEGHMALVSAASHEDTIEEMRPIFYRIIDSIEVRAPSNISGG